MSLFDSSCLKHTSKSPPKVHWSPFPLFNKVETVLSTNVFNCSRKVQHIRTKQIKYHQKYLLQESAIIVTSSIEISVSYSPVSNLSISWNLWIFGIIFFYIFRKIIMYIIVYINTINQAISPEISLIYILEW